MSYYLIASILVAVISILYVWYVTRYSHGIPNDKPLYLDNDDDKLLVHWYKMHIKQSYEFNVNDIEIASKYINRVYNVEINPSLLVIGNNLSDQYYTLTGNLLVDYYTQDSDCIFDLRSMTGKNIDVAIIYNPSIRKTLEYSNKSDLTDLNLIMENDLDLIAKEYLNEVLKLRWEQILQLNDPNLINGMGSFVYLNIDNNNYNQPITVFGNVIALMTPKGARINILCSNYEFEALIYRWKQYLTVSL